MSDSLHEPQRDLAMPCETFEASLGAFLEGVLDEQTQRSPYAHVMACTKCAALVRELNQLVASAGALPSLAPDRDLWPSIESRLETPVLTLRARPALTVESRTVSWRTVAAAAAVLVTLSAGVTWNVARRAPVGDVAVVPSLITPGDSMTLSSDPSTDGARVRTLDGQVDSGLPSGDGVVDGAPPRVLGAPLSDGARRGVLASAPSGAGSRPQAVNAVNSRVVAIDTLYGREIATLRSVAETQLGLLDSATVNVVRRNLDIIDAAILESRAALASDPNSGFLLEQLDRAYERKVDLLRRVALL